MGSFHVLGLLVLSLSGLCVGRWSQWTPCSKSCDRGLQFRNQLCEDFDGSWYICGRMYAECRILPCEDKWKFTDWTQCNRQCGGGLRQRISTTNSSKQEVIPCHKQNCEPPAGCGRADLVYVMDSSGSLSELNWFRVKQFSIDLIKSFTISADETHVGAVYYSTESKVAFTLNQHQNEAALEQALWAIPYMAGTTNTADALRDAKKMFQQKGRSDVKQIVVVITDGASNILNKTTVPMADELKAMGVEVFCIGIGNIRESEILGIAGEPKDERAFTVKDVAALQEITSIVVKGACKAASEVKCDPWGDFSLCTASCGGGTKQRTRTCVYKQDGTVVKTETESQRRQCNVQTCPTRIPTSTTKKPVAPASTADPSVIDCHRCNYTMNGLGYLEDPVDCTKYYQCVRQPNGGHIRYHMLCPAGLFWSQVYLTCMREPPYEHCVARTLAPKSTTQGSCALLEGSDLTHYIQLVHGVRMELPCPAGLIFYQALCRCDYPATPLPSVKTAACEDDLLLYYPFDNDVHDHSCNHAHSTQIGDVELRWDAKKGKSAYFSGTGRLEVPFMKNWFAGRQVDGFSITLWVKRTDTKSMVEGLVNNGDCVDSPSFDIHVGPGMVSNGGLETTAVQNINAFGNPQVTSYEWHHLAMIYNGAKLTYYQDGVEVASLSSFSGYIENRQCPMNIGHHGSDPNSGFFMGFIDELRLYKRALTAAEVAAFL